MFACLLDTFLLTVASDIDFMLTAEVRLDWETERQVVSVSSFGANILSVAVKNRSGQC